MKTEFKTSMSELVSEVELKLSNIMIVTHQKTINDAFDNSFREYACLSTA
jgi:broad specificity phosphatase PhoE